MGEKTKQFKEIKLFVTFAGLSIQYAKRYRNAGNKLKKYVMGEKNNSPGVVDSHLGGSVSALPCGMGTGPFGYKSRWTTVTSVTLGCQHESLQRKGLVT